MNARPAPGATSFPVGTMIVKEVRNEQKKTHEIFAMVKRGAGYNQRGAPGWEWFELTERRDESIAIAWRGINAPNGEDYAGDPLGGCNSCHELAAKNDYVRLRRSPSPERDSRAGIARAPNQIASRASWARNHQRNCLRR